MDSQGSSLPHIWAIEALACSDHVETSLLLDLLKKTPQIFDDVGNNVREMVSLKYLENLFIEAASANHVSSPLSKTVRLDLSDRCEDVLRRVLIETSLSHMKVAGAVISKWDLEPFIKHKRSIFRNYALKKLNDAFLTGRYSTLASLKEQSGPVRSHVEHRAPIKDGNCNGNTPRVEGNDADDGFNLPKGLHDENVVPVNSKKRTTESPSEQLCTTHANSSKKNKYDAIFNEQYVGGQHIEGKSFGLGRKTNVGKIGLLEPVEHDTNECTSSGLVDPDKILPCGKQVPHCDAELNNKSEEQQRQDHNIEEEGGKNEACDLERTEKIVGVSGDNDGYHDEMTAIDTKKKTFLSSQCTYRQDSLATSDWQELHLCMKCNKGGSLLSCTSDSCPIVIHESCLGSDASFDTRETFYCPFCEYSRAISKYMEVKEYASLARKDLETFIFSGAQNESNKQSSRSFRTDRYCLNQNDSLPRSDELNQINVAEKVRNHQHRNKSEDEQVGPSELLSDYSPPSGRKAVESTHRLVQSLKGDKQDGKRMRQESQPLKGCSIAVETVDNSHCETTSCHVPETNGNEKHADVRSKKGFPCPPELNLPCELKCTPSSQSADAEEISKEENEGSKASRYFMRVQKQEGKILYPAIPQTTRKRLPRTREIEEALEVKSYSASCIPRTRRKARPWTREEEEALENGFQKLCGHSDRSYIPWKQILELGEGIIHPSRSTIDLKDKWRNMCKASPKSK